MAVLPITAATGWRRPAAINTILLIFLAITLLILTLLAGNETESFTVNHLFYAARCETTRMLNLGLHLALNIIATLVLSSSLFVMQVLNSPTRAEVNAAHARDTSVDIGVPSLSNLFALSRFKACAWAVLAVFSLPVHMLLNSAVFETDFHGKSWNLTIAAEPFVSGAAFFLPGAALAFPGFDEGYGRPVDAAVYLNQSTQAALELQDTALTSGMWKRLDANTCMSEYLRCNPRQDFKDVVLVVNTAGNENTLGWTRTGVFDMGVAAAAEWDGLVPPDDTNSLWFSGTCEMAMAPEDGRGACTNSCGRVLGSNVNLGNTSNADQLGGSAWVIPFQERQAGTGMASGLSREGFRFDQFNDIEVRYCLAQEFQQTCKLGASPLMLGLSALCVAFVATQALFAVRNLLADLLVTPGDAIASFISDPDPTTEGMSTLSFQDRASPLSCETKRGSGYEPSGPREWIRRPKYMGSSIPAMTWLLTYLFLSGSLMTLAYSYFHFGIREVTPGAFGHSPENGHMRSMDVPDGAFILALLLANKTQVVLAACYYFYNGLLTRFMAEREWNAYSLAYQPLRVTSPRDAQTSTYRLQLPYKLGIPLIAVAALLHWTLSNTYYLGIFEGGYFGSDRQGLRRVEDNLGLAPDTTVALSYSVKALLVISIAAFLLVFLPVLLAFTKLRGDMVIAGADSQVISAACHPRLFVNVSNVNFRSPWDDVEKEGLRASTSRSPRDTRRSHKDGESVERNDWPLSSWPQNVTEGGASPASPHPPSPYGIRSPHGMGTLGHTRRSIYEPRIMSEYSDRQTQVMAHESQRLVVPVSPYGVLSPTAPRLASTLTTERRPTETSFYNSQRLSRTSTYEPQTMSEFGHRRSQAMIFESQKLMVPVSPYDALSPTTPRLVSTLMTERRPSDSTAYNSQRLTPLLSPYERDHRPRRPSEPTEPRPPPDSRPPSQWGKLKFEPSHNHDTAPPEPAGLEPPAVPWIAATVPTDDVTSPLAQTLRPTPSRRWGPTGLTILTPASATRRTLPWTAEAADGSAPGTPRVSVSVEREGVARERALRKLAGRSLRWGAMPAGGRKGSSRVFTEKGADRLGFGSVECGVARPEVGRVYE